jgi:hypothetical protein
MNNSPTVGATTKAGWFGGVVLILPTIIKAVEEITQGNNTVNLNGPEKYLAIGGIVILAITHIFRYLQSLKLIPVSVEKIVDEAGNVIGTVGSDFEKGTSLPIESAITPDGPTTTQVS